ncbi:MAG: hypothetical protein ABIO02_02290 [Patescibacteria group bacterium]
MNRYEDVPMNPMVAPDAYQISKVDSVKDTVPSTDRKSMIPPHWGLDELQSMENTLSYPVGAVGTASDDLNALMEVRQRIAELSNTINQ